MNLTPARALLLASYRRADAATVRPAGYPLTVPSATSFRTFPAQQLVRAAGAVVPSAASARTFTPMTYYQPAGEAANVSMQPGQVTVTGVPASPGARVVSYYRDNPLWTVLTVASVAVSAYHGTKRNDSVGWGIVWGLLGGVAPVITPAVALAQGFGKRKTS